MISRMMFTDMIGLTEEKQLKYGTMSFFQVRTTLKYSRI